MRLSCRYHTSYFLTTLECSFQDQVHSLIYVSSWLQTFFCLTLRLSHNFADCIWLVLFPSTNTYLYSECGNLSRTRKYRCLYKNPWIQLPWLELYIGDWWKFYVETTRQSSPLRTVPKSVYSTLKWNNSTMHFHIIDKKLLIPFCFPRSPFWFFMKDIQTLIVTEKQH